MNKPIPISLSALDIYDLITILQSGLSLKSYSIKEKERLK